MKNKKSYSKEKQIPASLIGRVAYCPYAAYLSTQDVKFSKGAIKSMDFGNKAHFAYSRRNKRVTRLKKLAMVFVVLIAIFCAGFLFWAY